MNNILDNLFTENIGEENCVNGDAASNMTNPLSDEDLSRPPAQGKNPEKVMLMVVQE